MLVSAFPTPPTTPATPILLTHPTLQVQHSFLLRPKTTMRIGGTVRYFTEPKTREEVQEAAAFAMEKHVPLLPLGSGSNTVFAETVDALVIRLKHDAVTVDDTTVTVGAGKNLAMLVNELGNIGLDLSPLTGIPGTVGGAIFGNAGQGPKGVWIDHFVRSVTVYMNGEWQRLSREACMFRYRESTFKEHAGSLVIFEAELAVPKGEPEVIKAQVESLLQKRIETQPHLKTAGSCFKAVGDTPAWKLIDAAGLRGKKIGGVEISSKHANFLLHTAEGSYADAVALVENVRKTVSEPLDVEMRFIEPDGSLRF